MSEATTRAQQHATYWRNEARISADDGHPEAALAAMAQAYDHEPPVDRDDALLAYARALGLHDWRPPPPPVPLDTGPPSA